MEGIGTKELEDFAGILHEFRLHRGDFALRQISRLGHVMVKRRTHIAGVRGYLPRIPLVTRPEGELPEKNLGVSHAVVGFLNVEKRLDNSFLAKLVKHFVESSAVQTIAKLLFSQLHCSAIQPHEDFVFDVRVRFLEDENYAENAV